MTMSKSVPSWGREVVGYRVVLLNSLEAVLFPCCLHVAPFGLSLITLIHSIIMN